MVSIPQLISTGTEGPPARLMDELLKLHYLSRAIFVAAEIGLADALEDGGVPVAVLAERTATDSPALKRLMRYLAAYGIFEQLAEDQFGQSELSDVLRDDHPGSIRARIRYQGAPWWNAAGAMLHTVTTGESAFTHANGAPFFDYLSRHPEHQGRFDAAMAQISVTDDAGIAAAGDFAHARLVVDVGGGGGGLLREILSRARDARGILFDQPHVADRAERPDDPALAARLSATGGDFFDAVPNGADCYVIKGVLHDFDDDRCVAILANCRDAMASGGRILVVERFLPPFGTGPHPNLTMDINMMVLMAGRERDEAEWNTIFARAGLAVGGIVATPVDFHIVEGVAA